MQEFFAIRGSDARADVQKHRKCFTERTAYSFAVEVSVE
jgi:hypothetical protein